MYIVQCSGMSTLSYPSLSLTIIFHLHSYHSPSFLTPLTLTLFLTLSLSPSPIIISRLSITNMFLLITLSLNLDCIRSILG